MDVLITEIVLPDNLPFADSSTKEFHFLLADDDSDDRYFFEKAITRIMPKTKVSFVEDGERLMKFLDANIEQLPAVLFLDLNMPRKNGSECLTEIRQNSKYDNMPVIIYSTGTPENVADFLYKNGAHHYVRKPDLAGLSKILQQVLDLLLNRNLKRPNREQFVWKVK